MRRPHPREGEDVQILSRATDPPRGGHLALGGSSRRCQYPSQIKRKRGEALMKGYRVHITVAVGVVAVLLTACGGGGGKSSTSGTTKGATVAITLQEWGITASPASVPAGKVNFDVTNKGPIHE